MKRPSCSDRLRRLFRDVALDQPPPAEPHPIDDEETLTSWSLDLLPPAEGAAFTDHLARCPACRTKLVRLIRADVIAAPPSAPALAAPTLRVVGPRRPAAWRRPWVVRTAFATAAAAAVLAAVVLWMLPRGNDPKAELARAESALQQGQSSAALSQLEGLLARSLDPPDRERAHRLLEQAAYGATREQLKQGRFPEAAGLVERVAREGVQSSRLDNLHMQANQKVPAEVTLACAGDLTHYGFDLNGLAPPWKDLPVVDKATQERDDEWKRLVAADPHNVALLLNYGQFQYSLSRYEQAKPLFTQAKVEDAGAAEADVGLGLVAYEKKAYEEALNHFEAALALDPNNAAAALNVAICMQRLDRAADARKYWERARDLARDPEQRKRLEAWLNRTQTKPE